MTMKALRIPIGRVEKDKQAGSGFVSDALPRGLAMFFGAFALVNVLGTMRVARFDANLWWIDLRWLPAWVASGFLAVAGTALVSFGLRRPRSSWRRSFYLICSLLLVM